MSGALDAAGNVAVGDNARVVNTVTTITRAKQARTSMNGEGRCFLNRHPNS